MRRGLLGALTRTPPPGPNDRQPEELWRPSTPTTEACGSTHSTTSVTVPACLSSVPGWARRPTSSSGCSTRGRPAGPGRRRARAWSQRRAGTGLHVGRSLRRPAGGDGDRRARPACRMGFSRGRRSRSAPPSTPPPVRGLVINDYWARHVGLPPQFADALKRQRNRGRTMEERMPPRDRPGGRGERGDPAWDRLSEPSARCW